MEDITLQALLEAGCHFGHKAERWHPKAASFIYTKKDGVHIIDLAKTKAGLEAAIAFVREVVAKGGEVLFVGTKRQAQGILTQEAQNAGAPYLAERWIGGFLTNWDTIHKNIQKINRMTEEQTTGAWKKFPKHEQTKLSHYLARIKIYYGGVLDITKVPEALFVVDIKKESAAVREGIRRGVPVVAMVDTNTNPEEIAYPIPANDDAVGSISYIVHVIAEAYKEGKAMREKQESDMSKKEKEKSETVGEKEEEKHEVKPVEKAKEIKSEEPKKKRGRPKKTL